MITGGQTDVEERIALSLSASPACVQHVAVATERVCTTGREEGGREERREGEENGVPNGDPPR